MARASTRGPAPSRTISRTAKEAPSTTFIKYLSFVLMLVCGLHTFHYFTNGDPLASPYINGQYVSIDSWSVIHLVLFIVIGYHYPNQLLAMMLGGIAWEVFEWLMQNHTKAFWEETHTNTLWDIWFNFMGYQIGDFMYALHNR
jgi:hypothetical protein